MASALAALERAAARAASFDERGRHHTQDGAHWTAASWCNATDELLAECMRACGLLRAGIARLRALPQRRNGVVSQRFSEEGVDARRSALRRRAV